jgi:hypothetical protein
MFFFVFNQLLGFLSFCSILSVSIDVSIECPSTVHRVSTSYTDIMLTQLTAVQHNVWKSTSNMLQNDAKRRNASTSVIKVSSMLANMIKLGTEVPARREHTDSAQHF